ncbi:MAG: MFS transporter [Anaerofustis sp.]
MSETKKYGIGVQIAALSVALLMYTTSMTTPALAQIAAAFPDASAETVKLLSTIPSLMMVVFSLISGKLTQVMSIKKVIILSMVLIFIGGIPSAFFGGLTFMLIMRVIFGAGYGLVFPMASAVIADLFTGDKGQRMMGLKSAVGAAAGVLFQMMGGILAVYNWRYAFLGFLLVLPIAVLVLIKLPDTGVKNVSKDDLPASGEKVKKVTTMTFVIAAICLLFNIVQFSFMIDMAFVLKGTGIGNAAGAATVLTIFSASAFVMGLIYGNIAKILKKFTAPTAALLVGISFFMLVFANSMGMIMLSAVIFGLGFGMFNPAITIAAAKSAAAPKFSAQAIAIYVSGTGIGQFLCPYALKALRNAFGMTAVKSDWQIAAVAILIGSIAAFVIIALSKKKAASTAE